MTERDPLIRQRAYELWDGAGRPDGREAEFWYKAEHEIECQLSKASAEGDGILQIEPSHITEHMQVISADHKVVGKVDGMVGADTIKLTKESPPAAKPIISFQLLG
jgi:hypothetical protein